MANWVNYFIQDHQFPGLNLMCARPGFGTKPYEALHDPHVNLAEKW